MGWAPGGVLLPGSAGSGRAGFALGLTREKGQALSGMYFMGTLTKGLHPPDLITPQRFPNT